MTGFMLYASLLFAVAPISNQSSWATSKLILKMATTTSTDNTGLLDYLKPEFLKASGIDLQWIATGTGKALKLGENCDVDVLMVHAPEAEKKYVSDGFGVNRREIMYNDFIIIGPSDDPAGIQGKSLKLALTTIKNKKAFFISRGDNSGTHKKEIKLWDSAGIPIPDKENWYIQTGQGMLATINVASERNGYLLVDRGTYIKYEDTKNGKPPLIILVQGDNNLKNQYSVIAVNPKKCSNVKYDLAMIFSDWIISETAQKLIQNFKLSGKTLFTPNAK